MKSGTNIFFTHTVTEQSHLLPAYRERGGYEASTRP
jgi:hypothetical protein